MDPLPHPLHIPWHRRLTERRLSTMAPSQSMHLATEPPYRGMSHQPNATARAGEVGHDDGQLLGQAGRE
jgi:hypothetical protein